MDVVRLPVALPLFPLNVVTILKRVVVAQPLKFSVIVTPAVAPAAIVPPLTGRPPTTLGAVVQVVPYVCVMVNELIVTPVAAKAAVLLMFSVHARALAAPLLALLIAPPSTEGTVTLHAVPPAAPVVVPGAHAWHVPLPAMA